MRILTFRTVPQGCATIWARESARLIFSIKGDIFSCLQKSIYSWLRVKADLSTKTMTIT